MPLPEVLVHYTEHAYPILDLAQKLRGHLDPCRCPWHDFASGLVLPYQPNGTAHASYTISMVQNENKYGYPHPCLCPNHQEQSTPRRTRPLQSIYFTKTRALGPCLCLRSYRTKRSPLSPSRHSYKTCAGIFALAPAETLHSGNTIDRLGSYPCHSSYARLWYRNYEGTLALTSAESAQY